MAHLSQIKNRICTVQKTQKITKSMRLIAMSFYSKLERQKVMLNTYRSASQALTALIQQGKAIVPARYTNQQAKDPAPLIIVCSSAKGLCGGLNNNLIRFFERSLINTKTAPPSFIAIGQKACSYLQEGRHGTIIEQIPQYHFNSLDTIVNTLLNHIMQSDKPYSSVSIFYTHLKNFFLQIPQKQAILPLVIEEKTDQLPATAINTNRYLWEQDATVLGQALIRQYLYSELTYTLFNNLISENAARFIAMDQSTNNANKYLEALNLTYNKSRQSIITREISELSSSFD